MNYLIRPIDSSEYDLLISLWRRAGLGHRPQGRDSFASMKSEFQRMETCFFGIFDGDKLIGSIIGTSDGRRGWLNRLAIDPDYRGQGLAGKLIAESEEFLHNLGIKIISCLIEEVNSPSITAFTKAGYKVHTDILYLSKRESDET
jgi:ribosomal protein S18 acetylase RimI-like enzyme